MAATKNLIALIERNAESLTRGWLSIVCSDPDTPTYHDFNRQELYDRAFRVYSQLGKWISHTTTKEAIAQYYAALGAERRREGFALSEVLKALMITRRVLWFKVQENGLLDTALDLHMALQLNNRVILFFDRAAFYTAVGYECEVPS